MNLAVDILTSSEIRRVVLTVLSNFLRQSCLIFTNVTSALKVFLNVMRYINPLFTYLLAYLLNPHLDAAPGPVSQTPCAHPISKPYCPLKSRLLA